MIAPTIFTARYKSRTLLNPTLMTFPTSIPYTVYNLAPNSNCIPNPNCNPNCDPIRNSNIDISLIFRLTLSLPYLDHSTWYS